MGGRGLSRAGHARSLMEGLTGTAIRLAVRDPSCPQAPVLDRARRHLAVVRGCSCGWLRPRPPIPARTMDSAEPARRVAYPLDRRCRARIFDERFHPR